MQGACFDHSKDATRNLLFGGQTVSVIGDALYAVALPWLILADRDRIVRAEGFGVDELQNRLDKIVGEAIPSQAR